MKLFLDELNELCDFHFNNCKEYRLIVYRLFGGFKKAKNLEELPFIPVSIFKDLDLTSVSRHEVFKTLSSSGTSGTQSRIFLDKKNSLNQTLALKELFQEQFGQARRPMIIFDSQEQLRSSASANGAHAKMLNTAKVFASTNVKTAIDSTGAGDAFSAGFLAKYLSFLTHGEAIDLMATLRAGNELLS